MNTTQPSRLGVRAKLQNLIDYNQELKLLKQVANFNRAYNSNTVMTTHNQGNTSRQGLSKTQKFLSFQSGSTKNKSSGVPDASDYNQND